jgi:hypothetical protein
MIRHHPPPLYHTAEQQYLHESSHFTSGGQGEVAWRLALGVQRQLYYSLCALRFALCAHPPAKAFDYFHLLSLKNR